MKIKTYKTKEEYISELQMQLSQLFKQAGYSSETFSRWLETTTKIASEQAEVISCLSERLVQGGIFMYPYRFSETKIPNSFNAHTKDDEIDGLLVIDNKELSGYDGTTYFERFLEGLRVAKEKFG